MTESEAITELRRRAYRTTCYGNKVLEHEENLVAIEALEKQIPKKPRFYAHNYYCSVCDSLIGNNEFEWKRFKYCDNCGQKLDWSEEKRY